MKNSKPLDMAPPVTVGVEDTFSYMISDECVGCEACVANCPMPNMLANLDSSLAAG